MIRYRCPRCGQTVALGVPAPVPHPPVCCRNPRSGHTHPPAVMVVDTEARKADDARLL
jgi:hypothetical protein